MSKRLRAVVVAAFVAGALLRLIWPTDIHYLADEAWTYGKLMAARAGEGWPSLGMATSRGPRNAPLSVWLFIVLGYVSGATTPEGLTRAVAVLGLVARAAALVIPWRLVKEPRDRLAWTWGIVLTLSTPTLVFLERQIWPPSLFPIFLVALVAAWMRRDTTLGALAWGFVGALLGQIQMAGFFFAPALAFWTKLFGDRATHAAAKRARWLPWLFGSAAGALPAAGWLVYLASDRPHVSGAPWWLRFRLEFYQYFFSEPSGLSGEFVLGRDVLSAMRYPIVLGVPTWLGAVGHVCAAVASFVIATRALAHLWRRRRHLRQMARGRTDTGILVAATLVGMGAMMTLPSMHVHRQYLLAAFPLPFVWAARAALLRPRAHRWLLLLSGGTFLLSFAFLSFLRDTGASAESGKTYRTQVIEGISPRAAKPGAREDDL